jgi:hypothetical protein
MPNVPVGIIQLWWRVHPQAMLIANAAQTLFEVDQTASLVRQTAQEMDLIHFAHVHNQAQLNLTYMLPLQLTERAPVTKTFIDELKLRCVRHVRPTVKLLVAEMTANVLVGPTPSGIIRQKNVNAIKDLTGTANPVKFAHKVCSVASTNRKIAQI